MPTEAPTYERPHVLLMVETSIAYGRGILTGITRWLRSQRRWSMYLEQHELSASPPAWLADWRGDGVICRVTDPQVAAILEQSKIPVVDLNDLHDDLGFAHIWSDHRAIGRLAAEHVIDRGFRRLGFCGFSDQRWSTLRLEGARERARRRHLRVRLVRAPGARLGARPRAAQGMAADVRAAVRRDRVQRPPWPAGARRRPSCRARRARGSGRDRCR